LKRISLVLIFLLAIAISGFAEKEIIVLERDDGMGIFNVEVNDLVKPDTEVVVYVHYPGSETVSYAGKAVANLEEALLMDVGDRVFFLRKRFIEKLVILDAAGGRELAMIEANK
jgi:hypothetical protein